MKSPATWAALCVLTAWASPAAAEPVEVAVQMLVKALPYDRLLQARCQERLMVGVLARAEEPASLAAAARWEGHLRDALKRHLGGCPAELRRLEARSAREVELATADRAYDLLLLGPGLAADVPDLAAMAGRRRVLLVAADAADVQHGAALGVDLESDPPRLVTNPSAARLQGADFAHSFLKVTQQVGGPATGSPPALRLYQQQALALVRRVAGAQPEYPPNALRRNREASLMVEILIGAEGEIRETRFLRSDPLFEAEVQAALRSWRFRPHLVDNAPVETVSVLRFEFKLEQR